MIIEIPAHLEKHFYNKSMPAFSPQDGLTKREFFAAIIMPGILADKTITVQEAITQTVECADLLLYALTEK